MSLNMRVAGMSPAELWSSPRTWAMLSTMSNRGVGFIVSLSISRQLNAQALALYIATVIAASTVTTPFVQMIFNAGTVGGARPAPATWLRQYLRRELVLVGLVAPVLMLVLAWMQWGISAPLSREVGSDTVWLVAVGISVVASQLMVAALSGLLNGMNLQLSTYRVLAVVSMATILLSFPAVWFWGMSGAWTVLICNSWMPVLLLSAMAQRALRRGPASSSRVPTSEDETEAALPDAGAEAWRQIRLCLPNALGVAASGLAGWLCSIKLVSMYHGAAGVATVAIANQWLTLVLVPVSSWGGVQLRELVGLRMQGKPWPEVKPVVRRLWWRNLATTGVLAALMAAGAPWLAMAYRMEGQGLVELVWISAGVALVATAYGLIESVVIAWERQWLLMRLMLVGLGAQIAVTLWLIDRSLLVTQWAALLAWVTMVALGWWLVRNHMTEDAS
jgi:hypothetical protein